MGRLRVRTVLLCASWVAKMVFVAFSVQLHLSHTISCMRAFLEAFIAAAGTPVSTVLHREALQLDETSMHSELYQRIYYCPGLGRLGYLSTTYCCITATALDCAVFLPGMVYSRRREKQRAATCITPNFATLSTAPCT